MRFPLPLPSLLKMEELGSPCAHSSLRCLGFVFFLLCLGSESSDIEYLGDRVCKVTFGLGPTCKGKRRFRL